MDSFRFVSPDDWHVHLRDGAMLTAVAPYTARQFGRAIVMPNLVPPVRNAVEAGAYRERILAAVPPGVSFEPLMVLYLTDETSAADIREAKASGFVYGVKWYPAGATTNSQAGVTQVDGRWPVFEAMQEVGMPLLVHGEVTDGEVDIFDREARFIDRHLVRVMAAFPALKTVFEHITTAEAAEFVVQGPQTLAATITAHHLLFNRNHMLVGGVRPHYYCLPVLKREKHREALMRLALSDHGRVFAGTDSAPHTQARKEAACGCAGAFTAPHAVELYAEAFDRAAGLGRAEVRARFEAFMSLNGPGFYGLPQHQGERELRREVWSVPKQVETPEGPVIPLMAGEEIGWRLV